MCTQTFKSSLPQIDASVTACRSSVGTSSDDSDHDTAAPSPTPSLTSILTTPTTLSGSGTATTPTPTPTPTRTPTPTPTPTRTPTPNSSTPTSDDEKYLINTFQGWFEFTLQCSPEPCRFCTERSSTGVRSCISQTPQQVRELCARSTRNCQKL